ncbi:MAG: glycosyltransferase, partial [Candidatus Eisenbacteria bacterium]|nr:glycosyltransferase [Candidatus Latescibacterota bacterium]MBD3301334.1 glycosyltransferase [Candidatus Eisenbacteria bacterium]
MTDAPRIGMLLDRPFPPDPRVANEARSLVRAGYRVALACWRLDDATPEEETWEGIDVWRTRIGSAFYRKASAISLEMPFYRWAVRRALARLDRSGPLAALHTHDLPMVSEGARFCRRRGIPLIADLHENWPAALRTYQYAQTRLGRILISPDRWAAHERAILPRADRIVVVIEEAKERLVALGLEPDRIAVVRNTVAVDEFSRFGVDRALLARFHGRFVISYLGGFDRHRGLESAVDAMPQILERIPDALLLLVGRGATETALRERAARLGLGDRVRFEGWQPFARFPSYLAASQVSLIPHLRNEHTDTTIPHKLFQTMLLERAVVVSDCRPLRRIVEETGCGTVYRSGDAGELARAVVAL